MYACVGLYKCRALQEKDKRSNYNFNMNQWTSTSGYTTCPSLITYLWPCGVSIATSVGKLAVASISLQLLETSAQELTPDSTFHTSAGMLTMHRHLAPSKHCTFRSFACKCSHLNKTSFLHSFFSVATNNSHNSHEGEGKQDKETRALAMVTYTGPSGYMTENDPLYQTSGWIICPQMVHLG